MKAYIPHYTPLTERHESIMKTCKELKLEPIIVSAYDKDYLINLPGWSEEWQKEWNNRLELIMPILLRNSNSNGSDSYIPKWTKYRPLKGAEVSLTYKHFLCLIQIAKSQECGLVLEDDILIKPSSASRLVKAMEILGSHADYIDLGGGCDLPIYESDKRFGEVGMFLHTNPPRSRTTAAYAVTPKAAMEIADELFPCIFPLDWSFQNIFIKKRMRVIWTEPSCLLHGSQTSMQSSIQ